MESGLNNYPPAGDLRKLFDERPVPVLSSEVVGKISFAEVSESDQAATFVKAFLDALRENNAEALRDCFFADQAYWKDALAFTYHLRTFLQIAGGLEWKIWILSTKLENLDIHPEDESLLYAQGRNMDNVQKIETDVFIIGGGNAASALTARLKALGVDSIMAERNARVGDNWALRYDCMKFHVPTSFCDMPYMGYPDKCRGTYCLSKDDLADHLARYVDSFNLNIITSVKIQSTVYDKSKQEWTILLQVPTGAVTVTAKHLVQATGVSSQKPYIPFVADKQMYTGVNIHSSGYKNGQTMVEQGVKSVLIIDSANTAFDILADCHAAGLQVTMVVRSPTYICPLEYICNDFSLGAYNFDVARGDKMFLTLPSAVEGQLARNLFRVLASQEPDRYAALKAAGFPVLDSTEPNQALFSNLIEKAGGHYVDVGATDLIAQGKVGVKAGVEPVAYTETGLRFSDGSTEDSDAVIWCTGFADRDVRDVAAEILGGHAANEFRSDENSLGPREIAARLDSTWGIDSEGEIRGMWKRHLGLDNYWVMGGYTQQHRWHSRTLALQIKASLEGILPPAYRETLGTG
ncbi:K+ transport flavoprotein [Fusarium beomiforme]|uniref:K+ transport flavoprotein n=1 Tax=Fusarium beomiforme TaxID=44412 RepID=A0A9P5AMZ6_9HYPO|nr:K+ transport flavoprotein [Fusarium beomiforme]